MELWRTVEDNTIILLQYTDVGKPKFYDSFLIGVLYILDVFSTYIKRQIPDIGFSSQSTDSYTINYYSTY